MKRILTLEIHRFPFNDNFRFKLKLFDKFTICKWDYYPITGQIK